MNSIVINLDSVWKVRSKQEGRYINRASITYEGVFYEQSGDGANLHKLIASVPWLEAHFNAQLRVVRGTTTCFEKVPLKAWLFPPNRQPEQLKKVKPTTHK